MIMNMLRVFGLTLALGLTSAVGQTYRDQITPFKMPAGIEFSNLRLVRQSADKTEAVLAFQYRYDGSAGAAAQIALVLEKHGEKSVSSWFGAEPLVVGTGRAPLSVKVKYFADEPGVPPEFTTDRVRVLLLNNSGNTIVASALFLRTIHWGRPSSKQTTAKNPLPIAPMGELTTPEKALQQAQPERDRQAADLAAAQAEAERLRKEKQTEQARAEAEAAARAKAMADAKAEAEKIAEEKRQAEAKAREEEQARLKAKEQADALAHQEDEAKAKADAEAREVARLRAEARLRELLKENELARQKAEAEAKEREAAQAQAEVKATELAAAKRRMDEKTAMIAEAANLKTKITSIEVVKRSLDRKEMVLGVEFNYQDHLNLPLLGVMVGRADDPQSLKYFASNPVEIGRSSRSFSLLSVDFQPPADTGAKPSAYATDQVMIYLQEANSPKRYVLLTAAKPLVWGTPAN